jgi:3-oxoacyl-[acyl-carrier-protein] synthase II
MAAHANDRDDTLRLAITGLGSINALGTGIDAYARGLRAGACGIGELTVIENSGFHSSRAAEVGDLSLPERVAPAIARRASRSSKLALIAATEAWQRAGLSHEDAAATAIVLGTTTGGMSRGERMYRDTRARTARKWRLIDWLETPVASVTDTLAQALGCSGPRLTISTACSSGAQAMGVAADWIRAGRATRVLCGGVDALCLMTYSGFDALHALDPAPCRPFDKSRAGLSLGEGAALFVLETFATARARGVEPLAELVGYGVSSDAHHLTQPRADGAGAILAMRLALERSGVAPEEIDYVNAHGTGTALNDVVETRAIKHVLGAHAYRIPVSSTKSQVGHCLAAAGAVEAAASIIALRESFVPPTASLSEPDPECDLDYVPRESRPADLRTVMSNSYGFGGNNASIVLRAVSN